MYSNGIDTFNNKPAEIEVRIYLITPDIIGLTEVNPKNANWSLQNQELHLQGYDLCRITEILSVHHATSSLGLFLRH